MKNTIFFEAILDNITDGVYVLDDRGNYVYVNSAYVRELNMPKNELLNYNVHDFLNTGQINFCISDIVYHEKRRIVMFQDVYDTQNYGRNNIRQMVISNPVFNEKGKIQNIIAVVRPLDELNELYVEASQANIVSSISPTRNTYSEVEESIIAESISMKNILSMARTVANVDSAVLITGESGTGKEIIAQYIHRTGFRRSKPIVVINCAALPENLLEAELFGYEKGAFTGAAPGGKKGLFEEAEGGSLFLDEINSMSLPLQGKLLRAIETKNIQRIGSTKSINVNFRLIAAANEDLETMVEEKRFRIDLYYRLNVIPLTLPPLRKRKDDIVPLASCFLKHFCEKHGKDKIFSSNTLNSIMAYDWPGNVRELKNFVERSVVISLDKIIEIHDVEGITGGRRSALNNRNNQINNLDYVPASEARYEKMIEEGMTLEEYLNSCERDYLRCALKICKNTYKTAKVLGTSQTSIMREEKNIIFEFSC
ncbi:MAG: sigma-54 interaction domain-containing protein [Aminipila sp.]